MGPWAEKRSGLFEWITRILPVGTNVPTGRGTIFHYAEDDIIQGLLLSKVCNNKVEIVLGGKSRDVF
jgi:hypothetical protein